MSQSQGSGIEPIERTEDVRWRCESCGEVSPRNGTPCNNCGGFQYERVATADPDTADAEKDDRTRTITVRWVVGYVYGALMGVMTIGAVAQGAVLGGIGLVLSAAVVMPHSRRQIERSFAVEITTAASIVLAALLLIVGLLLADPYV